MRCLVAVIPDRPGDVMSLVTLKKRHEFLRLRGGIRWGTQALLIEGKFRDHAPTEPQRTDQQKTSSLGRFGKYPDAGLPPGSRPSLAASQLASSHGTPTSHGPPTRAQDEDGPARFGFTVTKKLGSAVVRNRIRRRLREIVRSISDAEGLPGCDYVIVARDGALRRTPTDLRADVEKALTQINRKLTASRR